MYFPHHHAINLYCKCFSETETLTQGIFTSKAWHIEADKLCNDSTTLQDNMRQVEQQS